MVREFDAAFILRTRLPPAVLCSPLLGLDLRPPLIRAAANLKQLVLGEPAEYEEMQVGFFVKEARLLVVQIAHALDETEL
jgi:hypothetical protein